MGKIAIRAMGKTVEIFHNDIGPVDLFGDGLGDGDVPALPPPRSPSSAICAKSSSSPAFSLIIDRVFLISWEMDAEILAKTCTQVRSVVACCIFVAASSRNDSKIRTPRR